VNIDKPKELRGLNQKVGGWFGGVAERPTRAVSPPAEQSGPKVFAVGYVERGNPVPSPSGRLTVRHAAGGMGKEDGRSEGHPVMGWIRVESLKLNITRSVRELTSIGCFVAR
jgi:hypothetical protein